VRVANAFNTVNDAKQREKLNLKVSYMFFGISSTQLVTMFERESEVAASSLHISVPAKSQDAFPAYTSLLLISSGRIRRWENGHFDPSVSCSSRVVLPQPRRGRERHISDRLTCRSIPRMLLRISVLWHHSARAFAVV
jgi:hypothetical protein